MKAVLRFILSFVIAIIVSAVFQAVLEIGFGIESRILRMALGAIPCYMIIYNMNKKSFRGIE